MRPLKDRYNFDLSKSFYKENLSANKVAASISELIALSRPDLAAPNSMIGGWGGEGKEPL